VNGTLDFKYVNTPEEELDIEVLPTESFIELLFNNNYGADTSSISYNYLFKKTDLANLSKYNRRRIGASSKLIECYITDISGDTDIYDITDNTGECLVLLDKLLDYRLGYDTNLSGIVYNNLENTLSKNIFNYLNFMINGVYSEFDNTTIISSEIDVLNNMFELYALNEIHGIINNWKQTVISDIVYHRAVRKRFIIEDVEDFYDLTINDTPVDTDSITIIKNGSIMDSNSYNIIEDSSSFNITLDSSGDYGFNLKNNDIVIVDYVIDISEEV
jgi:hypothetical protein